MLFHLAGARQVLALLVHSVGQRPTRTAGQMSLSSSGDVWTSRPIRSSVGGRKWIGNASPLHSMSRLACIVCGLSNPEGSKLCSRCESPLDLQRCYRCESINTLTAMQCSQCG